jgi:hypothetical protein
VNAIILDSSQANDPTGERVRAALMANLQTDDWGMEKSLKWQPYMEAK